MFCIHSVSLELLEGIWNYLPEMFPKMRWFAECRLWLAQISSFLQVTCPALYLLDGLKKTDWLTEHFSYCNDVQVCQLRVMVKDTNATSYQYNAWIFCVSTLYLSKQSYRFLLSIHWELIASFGRILPYFSRDHIIFELVRYCLRMVIICCFKRRTLQNG